MVTAAHFSGSSPLPPPQDLSGQINDGSSTAYSATSEHNSRYLLSRIRCSKSKKARNSAQISAISQPFRGAMAPSELCG